MKFWWVNQGKTFKQELAGGYLWSPKTEKNGARSRFYDNMRAAEPGDLVVSYAKGGVLAFGEVEQLAVTAPKPADFGAAGSSWSSTGWLLPTAWHSLASPFKIAPVVTELRSKLPPKYSPLDRRGRGAQKAYLAEISEAAFEFLVDATQCLQGWRSDVQSSPALGALDDRLEQEILGSTYLSATEKRDIVLARRGQGRFRQNVLALHPTCTITNVTTPTLLVASHIKPWRSCDTSSERLDGYNGMMLTRNADHLFDKGLLTFRDDGRPQLSSRLSPKDAIALGLASLSDRVWRPLHPKRAEFMAYHRFNVFR